MTRAVGARGLSLTALIVVASSGPFVTAAPQLRPTGTIVFARDGALWTVPAAEPSATPTRATSDRLPEAITQLRSAADLVVASAGKQTAWVQLAVGRQRRFASATCTGPALPSGDGAAFVCLQAPGTALVQPVLWRATNHSLPRDATEVHFLGATSRLLVATNSELRTLRGTDGRSQQTLAPHRPSSDLVVDRSGSRAAGSYPDGTYVFKLDGTATRRKLGMPDKRPRAWSSDGKWLLLQSPTGACAMRATGGENLCWDSYRGLGFSPDAKFILLQRDDQIYIAPLRGVHAPAPTLAVANAAAATWLP